MPTIAEIKGGCTAEKNWVNGSLTVTVTNTKDSTGKGPSSCTLSDGSGSISGKFWGRAASQYNGCQIKIAGKGTSASEYNGVPEINIGDKATIQILGDAPASSASSQSAPTQQRAVSAQSGGSQAGLDHSPVRERVHLYLEVLKEVAAQYKHLQSTAEEGTVPKLTASDIKDVATHISMTYRGEYGSYAKPIFLKPQAEKPKEEKEDDLDYGAVDPNSEDLPFLCAFKSLGTAIF